MAAVALARWMTNAPKSWWACWTWFQMCSIVMCSTSRTRHRLTRISSPHLTWVLNVLYLFESLKYLGRFKWAQYRIAINWRPAARVPTPRRILLYAVEFAVRDLHRESDNTWFDTARTIDEITASGPGQFWQWNSKNGARGDLCHCCVHLWPKRGL